MPAAQCSYLIYFSVSNGEMDMRLGLAAYDESFKLKPKENPNWTSRYCQLSEPDYANKLAEFNFYFYFFITHIMRC